MKEVTLKKISNVTECVFFTSAAYKLYICSHCMMLYRVRKKKCSSFFWYKAIFVWFSQFFYDSSSTVGYFEQKRWPGTGSSPKTAGSQSVNCVVTVKYLIFIPFLASLNALKETTS